MKMLRMLILGCLAAWCLPNNVAQAGSRWSIGVSLAPHAPYCAHPHYWHDPWYPRPYYRTVIVPAPVYMRPVTVVQEVPVVERRVYESAPTTTVASPVPSTPTLQPVTETRYVESRTDVAIQMQQLTDPDERVRAHAVLQMGRAKAIQAVDSLAATLAGDASPTVREAAARALGLIGSPKAMPALERATQVDRSTEVRTSARFAIDVIQSR